MLISVSIMTKFKLEYQASDLQGFIIFIITQQKGSAILHNKEGNYSHVCSLFFGNYSTVYLIIKKKGYNLKAILKISEDFPVLMISI